MNKIQYELYKLMVVQIGIKALLFATEIASEYGVRFNADDYKFFLEPLMAMVKLEEVQKISRMHVSAELAYILDLLLNYEFLALSFASSEDQIEIWSMMERFVIVVSEARDRLKLFRERVLHGEEISVEVAADLLRIRGLANSVDYGETKRWVSEREFALTSTGSAPYEPAAVTGRSRSVDRACCMLNKIALEMHKLIVVQTGIQAYL
ncbi:MAG: hypothetical protein IPN71_08440 [Fibrobacteres bacterium]|nr:hypothetical protein [Fibrobacterota bacterium]